MIGESHKIRLVQPYEGFYHDYTENISLTKGKILFQRDAVNDTDGSFYLPDCVKERRKSLWGTIIKSNDDWLQVNDRAIIRRTAIVMPARPDREIFFANAKDVLVRMRNIKSLHELEPREGYLVLKMGKDMTHVGEIELPKNMIRISNVGEVLASGTEKFKPGDSVIVDRNMGLWLYEDLEGIQFDFRLNIVTEEAVFGIIESD